MIKDARFRMMRRRVPKFNIVTPPEATGGVRTERKITARFAFKTIRRAIRAIKRPEKLLTAAVTTAVSASHLEKVSADAADTQKISAIRLFKHLYSKYGMDWIEFDPMSFYRDPDLGEYYENILALKNILRRNEFFSSPYVFEKIALALSDEEIIQDVPQELSPDTMAYAIAIGNILRPEMAFSDEIEAYVVAQLMNCGFSVLLYPFDMEGPYIPLEVLDITKKVHDHIFGNVDRVDDVVNDQANKYVSLLSELANRILEDSDGIGQEEADVN